MKTLLILLAMFIFSCKNSIMPQESQALIGKWQFDLITYQKGKETTTFFDRKTVENGKNNLESNVRFTFKTDHSFIFEMEDYQKISTWQYDENTHEIVVKIDEEWHFTVKIIDNVFHFQTKSSNSFLGEDTDCFLSKVQ
jgi:hypothetical protein